jgi:hypothetical protein
MDTLFQVIEMPDATEDFPIAIAPIRQVALPPTVIPVDEQEVVAEHCWLFPSLELPPDMAASFATAAQQGAAARHNTASISQRQVAPKL